MLHIKVIFKSMTGPDNSLVKFISRHGVSERQNPLHLSSLSSTSGLTYRYIGDSRDSMNPPSQPKRRIFPVKKSLFSLVLFEVNLPQW